MSQNNIIKYWCEYCNGIVYWTAEDYAKKGEPVCTVCGNDMKIVDGTKLNPDE